MKVYNRLKSPLCVQVELTSACNCRCSHCYNYWRPSDEKPKFMTKETADLILDTMIKNDIRKACLTGGEPFLNFEMFKYLTEKMEENNIKVSTNTNLSAVKPEQLDFALSHNMRILTTILGSNALMHDGITNCKGSYNRSIESIKRCVAAGNDLMVNIVVSKAILDHVYEIADVLAGIGVKNIFISVVICPEYAKGTDKEALYTFDEDDIAKALNPLLDIREKYGINVGTITTFPLCSLSKVRDVTPFMNRRCVAGRTEIGISCEGIVSRCVQSGEYVGDLREEDFKDIWKKMEDSCTSDVIPEACAKCGLFKMCSGGCRVSAKSETGCWNGLDPKMNPKNIPIVLDNIKKNYKSLLPKEASGTCREEEFGSVYIRNDGNFSLLDRYFTDEELADEKIKEELKNHILPISLSEVGCQISENCDTCSLHDVCYNIHNCR